MPNRQQDICCVRTEVRAAGYSRKNLVAWHGPGRPTERPGPLSRARIGIQEPVGLKQIIGIDVNV
jgi:hypothetical protein